MKAESTRRAVPADRRLTVLLPYKAPFDWEAALAAFRAHQLPHLESVDDVAYERIVTTKHGTGWFRVEHEVDRHALRLSACNGSEERTNHLCRSGAQDVRCGRRSCGDRSGDEGGSTSLRNMDAVSGSQGRQIVEWI